MVLSIEKIKKIAAINNFFFKAINSNFYLSFNDLSNSEKKVYKHTLKKNNILFLDGLYILNYQVIGLFKTPNNPKEFINDIDAFKIFYDY